MRAVLEWARARLAERQRSVDGPPELIHDTAWAQVLRIPTDRGAVFCKTMFAPLAHEVAVTAALARWRPADATPVIAADPAGPFLLMEDAGERLRAILARDKDIRHFTGVLRRYAELQLAVAPHAGELVALGCPDHRSPALARAFAEVVESEELLTIAGAESLDAGELAALRALVPAVREWCAETSGVLPDSIQHDDLHDGQIFIRDGHVRFLDWGDANVAPAWYSLVVFERSLIHSFDLAPDAPVVLRLRDEYLEPFTAGATRARIAATLPIALRLGRLCRALTWLRVARSLAPDDGDRERAPGWFRLFLDPSLR